MNYRQKQIVSRVVTALLGPVILAISITGIRAAYEVDRAQYAEGIDCAGGGLFCGVRLSPNYQPQPELFNFADWFPSYVLHGWGGLPVFAATLALLAWLVWAASGRPFRPIPRNVSAEQAEAARTTRILSTS